jgi:hypothetical protein
MSGLVLEPIYRQIQHCKVVVAIMTLTVLVVNFVNEQLQQVLLIVRDIINQLIIIVGENQYHKVLHHMFV